MKKKQERKKVLEATLYMYQKGGIYICILYTYIYTVYIEREREIL